MISNFNIHIKIDEIKLGHAGGFMVFFIGGIDLSSLTIFWEIGFLLFCVCCRICYSL